MAEFDKSRLPSGQASENVDSTSPSAVYLADGEGRVSSPNLADSVGQQLQPLDAQKDALTNNSYSILSSSSHQVSTISNDVSIVTSSLEADSREATISSATDNEDVCGISKTDGASKPFSELYSIPSSSQQPVAETVKPKVELYSVPTLSPQPVAKTPEPKLELYSVPTPSPQPVAKTPEPKLELYSVPTPSPQPVAKTPEPKVELDPIPTPSPQPVALTTEKCPSAQDSESLKKEAVTDLSKTLESISKKQDSVPQKENSIAVDEAVASDIEENDVFEEESSPKRTKSLMDEKESTSTQSVKKSQNLERKPSRSASFSRALKRMTGKKDEGKIADADGNTLDMTDKAHGTLYLKKKKLFSLWRKYFFVLDGSQLTYFSNRELYGKLTGCQGSVDLTLLNNVFQKKATFCFRTFYPLLLERRSRSALYLGAETAEEQQRWFELLQRALETRRAASRRVSQAKAPSSSTSPDVVSSTLPNAKAKKKRSGSLTKKLSFRRKSTDKSHEKDHSSSEEELNLIREEKISLKEDSTGKSKEKDETEEPGIVQPKRILKVGIPGIASEIGNVRLKKTSQAVEKKPEASTDLKKLDSGSEGMFGIQLKKTNLKEKMMEDKFVTNQENLEDPVEERGHDFRSLLRSRRISTTGVDTKLYIKYGADNKTDDKDKKKRSPSPSLPLSKNVKSVLDNGTESSDLVTNDYSNQDKSLENNNAGDQEEFSVTDSPVVVRTHLDVIDLTNGKTCAVLHAVAQNIRYSDPPNELKPLESQLNSASKSPSPNPEKESSKDDEEGWEIVTSSPLGTDVILSVDEERPISTSEDGMPNKISQINNIFIKSAEHKIERTSTELELAEEKEETEPQSQSSNSLDNEEPRTEILPANFPTILQEENQEDSSNAYNIVLDNESSISLSPVHTMRIVEAKRKTHSLDSLDDFVSRTYELVPEDPQSSNSLEILEIKDESHESDHVNIESIMGTFHSQKLVTTHKEISESSDDEVVDSTVDEVVEPDIGEILELYEDKVGDTNSDEDEVGDTKSDDNDEAVDTNSDDDLEPPDDDAQVLPNDEKEGNRMQEHVDDGCTEDDTENFLRHGKPSHRESKPDDRTSEPVTFHLDTSNSSGTNSNSWHDSLPRPEYNPQLSIARSSSVESGEPLQRTSFMGTRSSWGASSFVDQSKSFNSDINVSKDNVSATNSMIASIDYTAADLQVPGIIRKVGAGSTDTLTTLKDTVPMRKLNQRKRPVSQPVSSNRDSLIMPEFVVVEEDVHDCNEQNNKEEI